MLFNKKNIFESNKFVEVAQVTTVGKLQTVCLVVSQLTESEHKTGKCQVACNQANYFEGMLRSLCYLDRCYLEVVFG